MFTSKKLITIINDNTDDIDLDEFTLIASDKDEGIINEDTDIGTTAENQTKKINIIGSSSADDANPLTERSFIDDETLELSNAYKLLNIELSEFAAIATPALKNDYLRFKLILKEIDSRNDINILKNVNHAFTLIKNTLTESPQNIYSDISLSLHQTYLRHLVDRDLGQRNGSLIKIDEKPGGVEPGYIGFDVLDLIRNIYETYPNIEDRRQYFSEQTTLDFLSLYRKTKGQLPRYMHKLTYDSTIGNYVIPDAKDLSNSKTIKKAHDIHPAIGKVSVLGYQMGKTTTTAEKNIEAIREALANDLARAYGLNVQDLYVNIDEYDNGLLRVTLYSKWIEGAKTLGPLYGLEKNKYRAIPLIGQHPEVHYLSDNSIPHLSEHYMAMVAFGDTDAIGSEGQNKLLKNNNFMGIDFGHVFVTMPKIRRDFRLADDQFKNFSIFYDYTRSDFARGLLYTAKSFKQENEQGETLEYKIDQAVINSYGDEFANKISKIKPDDEQAVFEDYEKYCQNAINTLDENSEAYQTQQKMLAEVRSIKTKAAKDRRELIEKFKDYLTLEKDVIDLIENIEKVLVGKENTTLCEEKVMLHHLKMTKCIADYISIHKDDTNQYHLIISESLDIERAEIIKNIKNWLSTQSGDHLIKIDEDDNKLIKISFKHDQLENLKNLFAEDKIKVAQHPKTYELYQNVCKQVSYEQEIMKLLKKISAAIDVGIKFKKEPQNNVYFLDCAVSKNGNLTTLLNFLKDWELLDYVIDARISGIETKRVCISPNKLGLLNAALTSYANNISPEASAKNKTTANKTRRKGGFYSKNVLAFFMPEGYYQGESVKTRTTPCNK